MEINKATNKTSVKDFVTKFKLLKSEETRKAAIKKIVYRSYCPIAEKQIALRASLDKSINKTEDDVQYIDLFASRINSTMMAVMLYTNLQLEKNEKGVPMVLEGYDLLFESGVLELICDEIGKDELAEFNLVNKTVIDTWHSQHSSAEAVVTNLINKVCASFVAATKSYTEEVKEIFSSPEMTSQLSALFPNK